MKIRLVNIFSHTMDVVLIYYFLTQIFGYKKLKLKQTSVKIAILILLHILIQYQFGFITLIGTVLSIAVATFIFAKIFDEDFQTILLYNIIGTTLMAILEISIMFSVIYIYYIFSLNITTKILAIELAVNFGKIIVLILMELKIIKIKIPRFIGEFNYKSIFILGSFNLLTITIVFTALLRVKQNSRLDYIYILSIALGSVLSTLFYIRSLKQITYQNQQANVLKLKEEEILKKDFYIESMKHILVTIKAQRHELNNYLTTLYGLVYLEDLDEAKKYISKINYRISNMNNIIETNHPIITAVVSMKKNKAFNNRINMDVNIDLPEHLPFDYIDLSIILNNLLNNAIEASLLLEEDKRYINLFIGYEDTNFIIQIKNGKSSLNKLNIKELRGRFTTKEDTENHGFGLGNIEFLVMQYGGDLEFEDRGNEFSVHITMPFGKTEYYDL